MRQHGAVATASPPSKASSRLRQSLSDMARSMALVFAFAAVVLFIGPARTLVLPPHTDPVTVVDYAGQVRAAASFAGHPVLAPTGLPVSWRATSARVDGGGGTPMTLHVGFVTPANAYAGVEETDGSTYDFLQGLLGKAGAARVDGTAQIDGVAWDVRHDASGQTALTRTDGGLTVVVTGSASRDELDALARALQPTAR